MAVLKPLKLRTEKVAKKQVPSKELPVAQVLVDTGVYHLDETFSYIVPADLDELCVPGVLVKIPFGRGITKGVILERTSGPTAGLKFIDKNLTNVPVVSTRQLELFGRVSKRYGSKVWDVLNLSFPTPTKGAENSGEATMPKSVEGSPSHCFYEVPTGFPLDRSLNDSILKHLARGSSKVVVIFPDEKSLYRASKTIKADVIISSNLKPSARFAAYLRANTMRSGVVFGLRSSVFLDCQLSDLLVIVNDVDESHYERRFPRYNTRDVALLRAQNVNLLFIFHSASLEIARLMDLGWLNHLEHSLNTEGSRRIKVHCEDGQPSKVHGLISEGLKRGSVLVVHANTGYVNSFLCAHCKNLALCECGGRLTQNNASSHVECSICGMLSPSWNCQHCQRSIRKNLGLGVEKRAEDYGRSFPRVRIVYSTADSPHLDPVDSGTLAICTPGMEPSGEFDTVILMDGEQLFSRTQLRGDEVSLLHWREAASLLSKDGQLYVSLPSHHFVSQAFIRGNFIHTYRNMIAERTSAHLPPYYRIATLVAEVEVALSVKEVLLHEFKAEQLHIFSTTVGAKLRLLLQISLDAADEVVHKLHEINRVRSLQGEKILPIAIDSFDLSSPME